MVIFRFSDLSARVIGAAGLPLLLLALPFLLTGCGTSSPQLEPERNQPADISIRRDAPHVPVFDFTALQTSLGMNYAREELGYHEKIFNACKQSLPISLGPDCSHAHFGVLLFKLMCRNSEDTVSEIVRAADTKAVGSQHLHWTIKGQTGDVQTDESGYAAIRVVAPTGLASQHIRLTLDNDFLYLTIADVSRILTPQSWCR